MENSNTFQGNPESGIDQFLNKSAEIEHIKAVIEGLERDKVMLNGYITEERKKFARVAQAFKQLVLDNELEHDTHAVKELAELLGVELTETRSVEFTVTVTLDIEAPIGHEVFAEPGEFFSFAVEQSWGSSEITWTEDSIEINNVSVSESNY